MEWLGQCASLIAKSGEPVVFTTPFNLPVMQPYRQTRKAKIQTVLQRITVCWGTRGGESDYFIIVLICLSFFFFFFFFSFFFFLSR